MTIEMIVALIAASIIAYVIADRFRLIAPVLLIAAGVAVAFLPVGEEMTLPSAVVLTIFLPILLYWGVAVRLPSTVCGAACAASSSAPRSSSPSQPPSSPSSVS